jgi:hypothetical protein
VQSCRCYEIQQDDWREGAVHHKFSGHQAVKLCECIVQATEVRSISIQAHALEVWVSSRGLDFAEPLPISF